MKDGISINGRTFLAEEFIRILDNYRSRRIVINRGEVERQKYCRIIFVLQLTSDYMQGIDFVADELSNFITRNMLYTEITRASEGVYLVGSVSNSKNSQVSVARQYVADYGVSTIQELLYT